jgi:hypothetical protein
MPGKKYDTEEERVEALKESKKKYYEKNKEKIKEKYRKNKETRERKKKYQTEEEKLEAIKESQKKYYERNKEKLKEDYEINKKSLEYYKENKEYILEKRIAKRLENQKEKEKNYKYISCRLVYIDDTEQLINLINILTKKLKVNQK